MTKLTRKIQWNSGAMLGWAKIDTKNTMNQSSISDQNETLSRTVTKKADKTMSSSAYFPQPSAGDTRGRRRIYRTPQPGGLSQRTYHPQTEFSKEFLEYLKTFSNRDFEHAVDINNNIVTGDKVAKAAKDTVGWKSPVEDILRARYRPTTVPSYRPKHVWDQNNRIVMKTLDHHGAGEVQTDVAAAQSALQKSKVTSDQIEYLFEGSESDSPPGTAQSVDEADGPNSSKTESDRPVSSISSGSGQGGSKRVSFAADVINYERENKPTKKKKLPKRRRPGFPHPSRGIFVPSPGEIVDSTGPSGCSRDNMYLNFTQVWIHPSGRASSPTVQSRQIRQERFTRLMNDLEHAHIHYNRLKPQNQTEYLISFIFRRYLLVLDLALTEGHLSQVEHLLDTIAKSVPVLQQNTFYQLYNNPWDSKVLDFNIPTAISTDEEDPNLTLLKYALSRISGNMPLEEESSMSIETVLVKVCLEIVALFITKYNSLEFRNALVVLPVTLRQALTLVREIRSGRESLPYIQWINNSAVQRDFRSILQNLGMQDKYGSKIEQQPSKTKLKRKSSMILIGKRVRTPPPPKSNEAPLEQPRNNSA